MKLRNLFVKLLFNQRQRNVIYKSLVYSSYAYRKRGNVDKAVNVQTVLNELSGVLGVIPKTFTKEQVDEIVNKLIEDARKFSKQAYFEGVKIGERSVANKYNKSNEPELSGIAVGTVIDVNKCNKCEHRDECMIANAISEVELEGGETEEKSNDAPENETPDESKESGEDSNTEASSQE